MYTLYSNVSKSLPNTSYMKAAEWWLLYHIACPFLLFATIFLEEHKLKILGNIEDEKYAGYVQALMRYFILFGKHVLPIITLLFVTGFMIAIFCVHYQ